MEGPEENLAPPALPVDAAELREWVPSLPGRMEGVPFQDRLQFFADVIALKAELKGLEDLALLLAREAPGSTLKLLAGPISKKSNKRASANRLEVLERRYPGGSVDMAEALQERIERIAAEAGGVQEELPLGDES